MNFAVQHATTKAPKHGETENYSGRRRSVTSWHVVPLWRWPGVKGSLGPLRFAAVFLRQPVRSRFPRGMEVDVSPASFVLDSGEVRESSTPKPSVLLRCLLEGRAAHSSSTGPPRPTYRCARPGRTAQGRPSRVSAAPLKMLVSPPLPSEGGNRGASVGDLEKSCPGSQPAPVVE